MKRIYILIILCFTVGNLLAQKPKSDSNIFGHVIAEGEHQPFVNVTLKGTTIGTATDETGHFRLLNLPSGKVTVRVQLMGYQPEEVEVELQAGESKELNFNLKTDLLGLEEVVVTGDRNAKNRRDASVIVNTITPQLFSVTQSVTLSEGLNFSPGVRMENNCQNCGFNQVRMNGMEGPYSQILINNRPIFSGLAGVYGLELIPSNMISRIEVVRGGGSALYGSNAIAGTINLILQDPIANSYELGFNGGASGVGLKGSGNAGSDYSVNANGSIVSEDNKTGMALYGFYRDRQPFDANNDGFSELTMIKNTTFGSRFFHRFGYRGKLAVDFFNIKENRRGGDRLDYPEHEAGIAESVKHDITTGAVTYEQFFRETDLWSLFASGQLVDRDSYYGANQSLKDYGKTRGFTYSVGTQYNANFTNSSLVLGFESRHETLNDRKLGYPDYENATVVNGEITHIPHTDDTTVADQQSNTTGAFAQYEIRLNRLSSSFGARFDHYRIADNEDDSNQESGNVLSPRVTLKYDWSNFLQSRLSYSQGYRAPQIYDEDLHIETSGSRKVIHRNDPNLTKETSHSFTASVDFNKQLGKVSFGLLAEGFYTKLNDAFVNEYGVPDENGVVVFTRTNAADGAVVQGVNLELNLVPGKNFNLKAGYTIQKSEFGAPHEFGEKRFFRTPNQYGFAAIDWDFAAKWCLSATGNYTGKMLVPYFGNTIANPDQGELRTTGSFMDIGMKISRDIRINGATLQLFAGAKNIVNAYQDDFDSGIDRDPGYIYGPSLPRTIYFGLKVGNLLK